jgi:hypothetical protein
MTAVAVYYTSADRCDTRFQAWMLPLALPMAVDHLTHGGKTRRCLSIPRHSGRHRRAFPLWRTQRHHPAIPERQAAPRNTAQLGLTDGLLPSPLPFVT